ncbi:MAG: diguanylate cyclase (GGDEF)-like protein [Halioglobus sp.]|jgi:diguanylate cyclase (GGDEF)-like protein
MEQIDPQSWALMHFGLIFTIACTQMVVVYALTGANNPTPGLGLYTVYFMAALLGWIAYTLRESADIPMLVDVPSVTAILNGYILYLAAGQRTDSQFARMPLGVICLLACLSVFFLSAERMFVVQNAAVLLFFSGFALLCARRAWRKSNVGDAIAATAGLLVIVGNPIALYLWLVTADYPLAHAIVFGVHTAAFTLVAMGFLASVLIEYQHDLSHMATEDPLTRLLNRRGLENALQVTMAQSARQQAPTAAIVVDIDHFREVNANFGAETGDGVILQIAQYLQRLSRTSDVVARIGGEEFLLILPNTELDEARSLAERIRNAIAERPLLVNGQRIAVTVSLGLAGTVGDMDLDRLSGEAERAMNLAKQGGRNRIASVESKPIHLSTTARET